MKQKIILLFAVFIAAACAFTGCNNKIEGCTNSMATNYNADATEDDGSCIILGCMDSEAENYNPLATVSDNSCTFARDQFIGTYSCQEQCGPDNYFYSLAIVTSNTGSNKVIIQNLGDFVTQVNAVATIDGDNITIDAATYNNLSITGSGSLNGNVLTLFYTATDLSSGQNISCNITATKS